ncbi:MAG: hypothetical protein OEQ39_19795 [Gammaproteobacteria bacterium]|nr:hypothetical protein [Gammaproteobacteria bacterium]MDH3466963.1 hypothetical protein [Gammaproteobacteria bacterium]
MKPTRHLVYKGIEHRPMESVMGSPELIIIVAVIATVGTCATDILAMGHRGEIDDKHGMQLSRLAVPKGAQ